MHKGLSLIEVLFVLGILAVLLGGTLLLLSQANTRLKAIQTEGEIVALLKIAQGVRGSDTVSANSIANSGTFPQKFIKDNALVTAFGTPILFNADSNSYTIVATSIGKAACNMIITQDFGNLAAVVSVNGQKYIMKNGNIKPDQATSMCSSSTNDISLLSE